MPLQRPSADRRRSGINAALLSRFIESHHDLTHAHWGHEPQRSAEPLLGGDLPTANAPCWKPALRFMERPDLQKLDVS